MVMRSRSILLLSENLALSTFPRGGEGGEGILPAQEGLKGPEMPRALGTLGWTTPPTWPL